MAVVICFLSTAAVGPCLAASWPRQPEVRLLDGYKSPLDEGFPGEEDYYGGSSAEQLPAGEDVAGGGGGGAAGDDGPEIDIGKKEIPLCQRECMSKFSEAAKLAFQSGNNYERYKGVCENYNKTIVCMEKLEGESCANQETFHVITSGLRYMCIEQRKAFEAVMECVDAQAAEVEKECELVCHVKERLAHWAVQSGILDNFMQTVLSSLANGETFASNIFGRDAAGGLGGAFTGAGMHRMSGDGEQPQGGLKQQAAAATAAAIKEAAKAAARRNRVDIGAASPIRPATGAGSGGGAAPRQLDFGQQNLAPAPPPLSKRLTPDFMRSIVQDGCELTRCQLICIRVKFDAKCGGSAGTLLSEAFVRPIAQAQEFLSYGSVAPFMGAFLPHQCDFMVKKEVLNEFRIPPELDEALHKKHDGEDEGKEVASMNEDGKGKGKKKSTENAAENASNEPEKGEEANEPPEKAADASQSQLTVGKGKGRQMPPAAAAAAANASSSADQQQSGPAMPVVLVPGFSSPLDNTDYYEDVEEWESGAFNSNAGQQQQKPQPPPQHPAPPPPPAPVAPPQRKPQRPQQPQFQPPPPQQQQGSGMAGKEGTKQKTPEVEGGVYPGDLQRVSHVVGQTNTGGGGRRGRNRQ